MRDDRKHAKAGNLNAALPHTSGDIIVIFDGDHAPEPEFLERSLGYFADPDVGFVQVMLTFRNSDEGWVPRAAAESSLDYYNPTCIGADCIGSATLVGSNALIRRVLRWSPSAAIGRAWPKTLATSIALHAAGWKSVYVAEPLAPGLAPPDLRGWFTQQIKWSRGVFEVLIMDAPRLWRKLTWGQRLSYTVRMSYYWIGLMVFVHLAFVIAMLLGNERWPIIDFNGYLTHIAPLAICAVVIRQLALYYLASRVDASEPALAGHGAGLRNLARLRAILALGACTHPAEISAHAQTARRVASTACGWRRRSL